MTDAPKLSRGWKRYHELRLADDAAKAEIIAGLTRDLGRPATTNDALAIEDIASLTILARVLERRGKLVEAAGIRDQINRTRRANGFRPQPIKPQDNRITPLEYARAHGRSNESDAAL